MPAFRDPCPCFVLLGFLAHAQPSTDRQTNWAVDQNLFAGSECRHETVGSKGTTEWPGDFGPIIQVRQRCDMKEVTASEAAKWATIPSLLLLALSTALDFARDYTDRDHAREPTSPDVLLFVQGGVALLCLGALSAAIVAVTVSILQRRLGDAHAA